MPAAPARRTAARRRAPRVRSTTRAAVLDRYGGPEVLTLRIVPVPAPGKPLSRLLDGVRRGGRVAFPNGVEPVARKRRRISLQSYDATPGLREFERLGRAIAATRLQVPIAASYPLGQAAKAHARLAKGHVLGKIVTRARPVARRCQRREQTLMDLRTNRATTESAGAESVTDRTTGRRLFYVQAADLDRWPP